MTAELRIDHLMTKVDSPQDAGAWFERCGFTVTPYSEIGAMGLCNRLVLFDPQVPGMANFIELMGMLPGQVVQPAMAALLAGDEGLRSMVLVSDDAHASRAMLAQRGFNPGAVHHVTRRWELPGENLDLAFDVLLPMAAPLPFNVCRYHTLQHYLRPQWTKHANGVRHVDAVFGVVDEVAHALAFYERLFDTAAQRIGAGHAVLRRGPAALELFNAETYDAFMGRDAKLGMAGLRGYRLRCDDAGVTAGWFRRAGVEATWREVAKGEAGWQVRAFGCDLLLV